MQTRRRVLTTAAAGAATLSVGSTLGAAGSDDAADRGDDTQRSDGGNDHERDVDADRPTQFGVDDGSGFAFANAHAVRATDALAAGATDAFTARLEDAIGGVGVDPDDVTAVTFGPDHLALTGDFPATAVQLRMLFDGYDAEGTHAGYDVYGGDTDAVAFADGELFRTDGELGDADGVRTVVDTALGSTSAGSTGGSSGERPTRDGSIDDLLAALGDGDVVAGRRVTADRRDDTTGRVGRYDAVGLSRRFHGPLVTERRALAFGRPGAVPTDAVGSLATREAWFDGVETTRFETAGCAVVEGTYPASAVEQVLP